ncbi:MAG: ADP-ribosylglycohydrolase family protein [Chitinophagaceae bacterium]
MSLLTTSERFEACIIAGAIGDAWGSCYENIQPRNKYNTYYLGISSEPQENWELTDDTQLTLATCEALTDMADFSAEQLAQSFVRHYRSKQLTGIGSSTLKALRELDAGIHWTQAGRTGEYAAGNGAAMRIAPLAFFEYITKEDIRNATRITHRNDEAYTGALAIVIAIQAIIKKEWTGNNSLFDIIIPQLPDTNVKDRMIAISTSGTTSIQEIASLGVTGYVADSVPFAIYAAAQAPSIGIENMFQQIIASGGDTDTNASIAGQIAGTYLGMANIPGPLISKLQTLYNYPHLIRIIDKAKEYIR